MRHNKRNRQPKGRLAKRLKSIPRTRTFRNAKGIVSMPPLDYSLQVLEALDQLPMEARDAAGDASSRVRQLEDGMSETRFTPGPWKWIGWNYRDFAQDRYEGKLWSEADQCPVLRGTTTEGEDPRVDVVNPFDGYLISAAPDLYAELQMQRDGMVCVCGLNETVKAFGSGIRCGSCAIDRALAKARGEEPKP